MTIERSDIELRRTQDLANIINKNCLDLVDNDDYKYYFTNNYINTLEPLTDVGWRDDGYIIYHSGKYESSVAGHIIWTISQPINTITNIGLMIYPNYTCDSIGSFVMRKVIDYLLTKRNFRRITFYCVKDNPAKKIYDQIITTIGGKIIGTETKAVKLLDNKFYDTINYEILKENYHEI